MAIDRRYGSGEASDVAQKVVQRAIDTQVPDHVKTGVKLTGVTLTGTAAVTLAHKLGRALAGWHTMRAYSATGPTDVAETAADDKTVTFARSSATGAVTYDFWVF